MIEFKKISQVLTASGSVGKTGSAKYFHGLIIESNGAAAGKAQVYDGVGTDGTLKLTLTCLATAADSRSVSGWNTYCSDGIYVVISNANSVSIEYSGA